MTSPGKQYRFSGVVFVGHARLRVLLERSSSPYAHACMYAVVLGSVNVTIIDHAHHRVVLLRSGGRPGHDVDVPTKLASYVRQCKGTVESNRPLISREEEIILLLGTN